MDDSATTEKSCQPTASMGTGVDGLPGVRVLLSNLTDYSYIQSDDQNLWYNNSGNFQCIKQCQVNLKYIFQHDYDQSSCHIFKCGNSRCKTCPNLDTSGSFTSSLTNKSYCTQGFEDFNCRTSNLIYGIECSLCRLILEYICINVCIIKIHNPRAHEVKNQRVIAKRTSQIIKYGQDVIIQKRTDDNIQ